MSINANSVSVETLAPLTFKLKCNFGGFQMNGDHIEPIEPITVSVEDAHPQALHEEAMHRGRSSSAGEDTSDSMKYATYDSNVSSIASDDSIDFEVKQEQDVNMPDSTVIHPWNVVDYHLYLCSLEKGTDTHTRRNRTFIYDGLDCRLISFHEIFEPEAFHPDKVGVAPQFLICALPIADKGHRFNGRNYVLGFDWNNRTLFARHFDWIPEQTDDLWGVWDDGFTKYSVTVTDLLLLLRMSFTKGSVNIGMGVLSSSDYCVSGKLGDDPGLEIVMAITFCQWLLDFAELVFEDDETVDYFTQQLGHYMEEMRIVLQRASYRAWFAVKQGLTREEYRHLSAVDKYTSDIYTFKDSIETGSLNGVDWHAPGLDTCKVIRDNHRMMRKQQTEEGLMKLFTTPEDEECNISKEVINDMVAKSAAGCAAFKEFLRLGEPEPELAGPKTAEPRSSTPNMASVQGFNSESPDTISNIAEEQFAVTEYNKIPLVLILQRALELVEGQPELDTFENRGQLGQLLTEMGIGIQRGHVDQFSRVPTFGFENDSWGFSHSEGEKPGVRGLLPSAIE